MEQTNTPIGQWDIASIVGLCVFTIIQLLFLIAVMLP